MYKSGFGLDSLTMNQGFFLPFSFLAVKWEKGEKKKKKKVKTKKGDFQGKRLTDIWFYKVFLSFLSFINFLFVSLLAFLSICLSLLLFVCFRTRQKFEYLRLKTQEKTKKLLKFQRVQKVAKNIEHALCLFYGSLLVLRAVQACTKITYSNSQ